MLFTFYVDEIYEDPCKPNPCQNGGTCTDGTCSCEPGCSGEKCEKCGKYLEPWMYSLFERRFWKNGFSWYNFLTITYYIEHWMSSL